jgi:hypothetical protein
VNIRIAIAKRNILKKPIISPRNQSKPDVFQKMVPPFISVGFPGSLRLELFSPG